MFHQGKRRDYNAGHKGKKKLMKRRARTESGTGRPGHGAYGRFSNDEKIRGRKKGGEESETALERKKEKKKKFRKNC